MIRIVKFDGLSPLHVAFEDPDLIALVSKFERREGVAPEGSGGRNSNRFNFGFVENIGMRTAAERLRAEYARFTGASKPGTRRL